MGRMSVLDVLVPSRRRALEQLLEDESAARVEAERELKRAQAAERCVREDLAHAQRVIRGMTYDLDDAQRAEEELTEELFDARDELAALHQALADPMRALDGAGVTPVGRVYYVAAALQAMAERHGADSQFAHLWRQLQARAYRVDASGRTPMEGAPLVGLDPAEDVACGGEAA